MTERKITHLHTDDQFIETIEEWLDELLEKNPLLTPGETVLLLMLEKQKRELKRKNKKDRGFSSTSERSNPVL